MMSKESQEINRWARGLQAILMGLKGETGWQHVLKNRRSYHR